MQLCGTCKGRGKQGNVATCVPCGVFLGGHKMAEFGNTFHASLTLKELPGVKPKKKAGHLFMMYIVGPRFVVGCASCRLSEKVK